MQSLIRRLDDAAVTLTETERVLRDHGPGPAVLGADHGGLPGGLGRDLHRRWVAALTARAREAADTAAGIRELGEAVHTTARRFAETDDDAARRLRLEP